MHDSKSTGWLRDEEKINVAKEDGKTGTSSDQSSASTQAGAYVQHDGERLTLVWQQEMADWYCLVKEEGDFL